MKKIVNQTKRLCRRLVFLLHLRHGDLVGSSVLDNDDAFVSVLSGPDTVGALIESLRFFDLRLHVVVQGVCSGYEPIALGFRVAGEPCGLGMPPGYLVCSSAGVEYDAYSEQRVLVIAEARSFGCRQAELITVGELIGWLRECDPDQRVAVEVDVFSYERIGLFVRVAGEFAYRCDSRMSDCALVGPSVGVYRNPYCKREVLVIGNRYGTSRC